MPHIPIETIRFVYFLIFEPISSRQQALQKHRIHVLVPQITILMYVELSGFYIRQRSLRNAKPSIMWSSREQAV